MEDEEKAAESLELDKLKVSAKETQAEETPPSSETQDEQAVSETKKVAFSNILIPLVKDKIFVLAKDKVFIISLLAGMVAALLLLCYPALQKLLSPGEGYDTDSALRITYTVSSAIGDDHHVRFKLSVPFRDNEEKRDLMRKLPKIKDELPMCGTLPEVAEAIQKKDLDALKKEILRIVNDIIGVPIEALGLEGLSLE
jgi:hypothetical protein